MTPIIDNEIAATGLDLFASRNRYRTDAGDRFDYFLDDARRDLSTRRNPRLPAENDRSFTAGAERNRPSTALDETEDLQPPDDTAAVLPPAEDQKKPDVAPDSSDNSSAQTDAADTDAQPHAATELTITENSQPGSHAESSTSQTVGPTANQGQQLLSTSPTTITTSASPNQTPTFDTPQMPTPAAMPPNTLLPNTAAPAQTADAAEIPPQNPLLAQPQTLTTPSTPLQTLIDAETETTSDQFNPTQTLKNQISPLSATEQSQTPAAATTTENSTPPVLTDAAHEWQSRLAAMQDQQNDPPVAAQQSNTPQPVVMETVSASLTQQDNSRQNPQPQADDSSAAQGQLESAEKPATLAELFTVRKSEASHPTLMQENVDRVVKAAQTALTRGASTIRLRLDPPELGSLRIEIRQSAQGLQLQLQATNLRAQQLLQQNSNELRAALESVGLHTNHIDVQLRLDLRNDQSQHAQQQQQQQQSPNQHTHHQQSHSQPFDSPPRQQHPDTHAPSLDPTNTDFHDTSVPISDMPASTFDPEPTPRQTWRQIQFTTIDFKA